MTARAARWTIAAGATLALADAAIVTLALPPLLTDLDTTVEGVAAVIAVYTGVLAAALPAAAWMTRRWGWRWVGAAAFVLFALASAGCAAAGSLAVLLVLRAVQAIGGAGALVAAFEALEGKRTDAHGGRLWGFAAIFGAAVGPALGGVLTQAFDWRAIFIVQAPIALAAAVGCIVDKRRAAVDPPLVTPEPPSEDPEAAVAATVRWRRYSLVTALALVSAALTAVLFLLVLLLVAGWGETPIAAAAAVSVLPVAAIAGSRIRGTPISRTVAGSILIAGGVAALALLPDAELWWTIAPQVLAGVGMGMALPALAGELIPERTATDAANLLAARHAGIAVALVVLAPIVASSLDSAIETATERGTAVLLDAPLDPLDKVRLAPRLLGPVDAEDPRGEIERTFAAERDTLDAKDRPVLDQIETKADETVLLAIDEAFRPALLIAAGLALLGAVVVLGVGWYIRREVAAADAAASSGGGRRQLVVTSQRGALPTAALAATVITLCGYGIATATLAPEPVRIADPCQPRELPGRGGLAGAVQDVALTALDRAACRFGSSREELALALADEERAKRFEERHGVDPRSISNLLDAVF